jgi:hypothetical protein
MTLRNDSFKVPIFKGMILHHDGEPLFRRVHGRAFWNGPRLEDSGDLQAKVVMEMGGMVFVDDEFHKLFLS